MQHRLPATALATALLAAAASAQQTERVSVDSSGAEAVQDCAVRVGGITASGRIAAFDSLSNLVPNDLNGQPDVFVHDRDSGITERASVDSSGIEGDRESEGETLSADGRFVAFHSYATNLVAGDSNATWDVFVRDRVLGTTERVSVDSSGAEGNGGSLRPSLSADGLLVVFDSDASNFVPGDTNHVPDVFVYDRATGVIERVSVDSSGAEADRGGDFAAISADGRFVAFESTATNLVAGDTNGVQDIFVHDRTTGITERVSINSPGHQQNGWAFAPAISGDGRFVAFESAATNLVPNDSNRVDDVFVHDRTTGVTERVSVDSTGAQADAESRSASLSADGSIVAFTSVANNLVPGDFNGRWDAFIRDRVAGTTERVSVDSSGAQANSDSYDVSISADGEIVEFDSLASNLVAGDTNRKWDAFVHDRCGVVASWSNYGNGWPGTLGVPGFTARANPVIGTTVTLDVDNSLGLPTAALMFIGFQRADLPTGRGGDLLVDVALTLPISFAYSGDTFSGDLPDDGRLCGTTFDLQVIELDPGASNGISFTPGLELVLGR